jgi:hypothetical protein
MTPSAASRSRLNSTGPAPCRRDEVVGRPRRAGAARSRRRCESIRVRLPAGQARQMVKSSVGRCRRGSSGRPARRFDATVCISAFTAPVHGLLLLNRYLLSEARHLLLRPVAGYRDLLDTPVRSPFDRPRRTERDPHIGWLQMSFGDAHDSRLSARRREH